MQRSASSPVEWAFLYGRLRQQFGWKFLRWWIFLIILGAVSAAITPFYGVPLQALSRLLGYALIFVFLYCAFYSVRVYPRETIAQWISLGYAPILIYAIIEAMATREVYWAHEIVLWVRNTIIVSHVWDKRTAFLTTEPSFLSFQLLLLIAIFPFLKNAILRVTNLLLILIALIFSQSGMLILIFLIYGISFVLFSLRRTFQVWAIAAGSLALMSLAALYQFSATMQADVAALTQIPAIPIHRLDRVLVSISIRVSHFLNLIYTLIDTYGVGLGIGQYGHFWKEIYLRHIDYQAFDRFGEVAATLKSFYYMRPWSMILGFGVDLGVVGMGLLLAFLCQIFQTAKTGHASSIVVVSIVALLGAYPIVTPHVWLALGLMGGYGLLNEQNC